MDAFLFTQVISAASFIGSIAFSLSGFLLGARRHLDMMGVFIVAFLTANGGGVVRDILVDRPPAVLQSTEPFWLVAAAVFAAWLLRLHRYAIMEKRWVFIFCDAVGLSAFAIGGAMVGIEENLHIFGVLTLALLTATGGGILRDMLLNNVPEVLHGGFYGSIALILGLAIYGLHSTDLLSPLLLLVLFSSAVIMRLIAHRKQWRLPKIRTEHS